MKTPPTLPAAPAPKTADLPVVVNDSVRRDGGKQTEDERVTTDQIQKIGQTALDHTAEEAGS